MKIDNKIKTINLNLCVLVFIISFFFLFGMAASNKINEIKESTPLIK